VMARLLEEADVLAGPAVTRWHAIQHSCGKERKAKLYRELVAV
jgi:hypothetical protein